MHGIRAIELHHVGLRLSAKQISLSLLWSDGSHDSGRWCQDCLASIGDRHSQSMENQTKAPDLAGALVWVNGKKW